MNKTILITILGFIHGLLGWSSTDIYEKLLREVAIKDSVQGPRPLPMAAHWHNSNFPLDLQIEMISKGHHIMPFIYVMQRGASPKRVDAYLRSIEKGMKTLAKMKVPFAMVTGGQWEAAFYSAPDLKTLPPEKSGRALNLNGKLENMVSPYSPIEPWRELGRSWTDNNYFKKLSALYPDPPRVVIISNNEAKDLRWHASEKSKRYVEKYGKGKGKEEIRNIYMNEYIKRYSALIEGMREGLSNEAWKKAARFTGYNAFGPAHFGREPDASLGKWLTVTNEKITGEMHAWEGSVPEAYDNGWQHHKFDHKAWSCQVEMMNLHFMKKQAFKVNPDLWFENIFWDGGMTKAVQYENRGLLYGADRYEAWVQYVIWTLTPRIVRQWNGHSQKRGEWWNSFAGLQRSVDRVHQNELLTRFWRSGRLVANNEDAHPFHHDIPKRWRGESRWFHLRTDRDPPKPWKLASTFPVFTLARVIGKKPRREWLLYAHAPLGDAKQVSVKIPEYREIKVDIDFSGCFFHIREKGAKVGKVETSFLAKHNQAPTANEDHYEMVANEELVVTPFRYSGGQPLLVNDVDREGDLLKAVLEEGPKSGSLKLNENGSFSYLPTKKFLGKVSFTYRAHDGVKSSGPCKVVIQVHPRPSAVVDDSSADFEMVAFPYRKKTPAGGVHYWSANPGKVSTSRASWTFSKLNQGKYRVFATWPDFSYQRPDKVEYRIFDSGKLLATRYGNQTAAPQGNEFEGRGWWELGSYSVSSGSLRVEVGNAANGRWVVVDSLRILSAQGKNQVIDDGEKGFEIHTSWNSSERGYGKGSRWTRTKVRPRLKRGEKDTKNYDQAKWTTPELETGKYLVYATWPADTKIRRQVNFEIMLDGRRAKSFQVKQSRLVEHLSAGGVWWQKLGLVELSKKQSIGVRLKAAVRKGKDNAIADAIAVIRDE